MCYRSPCEYKRLFVVFSIFKAPAAMAISFLPYHALELNHEIASFAMSRISRDASALSFIDFALPFLHQLHGWTTVSVFRRLVI